MKICFLGNADSVHLHKWTEYFSKRGHEIVILSFSDGNCPGAKVYSFEEENIYEKTDVQKIFDYGKHIRKARKIIKKEKPDILHAHYATSYGFLAARIGVKPYILSVWGSDVYDFPERSFLHRAFLKYTLRPAELILSTSEDMKRQTLKFTDKEIRVTPFGIDPKVFRVTKKREYDKEHLTFGTVKTFLPVYGLEYLVKAFKKLIDKTNDDKLKLILAGRGPEEESLRQLVKDLNIEEQVEFKGFLPIEEVVDTFNEIDVSVIPSLRESFGVSAVEAQACGCAVIASRTGGLPEAAKEDYSALFFEPKNIDELTEKMLLLYEDRKLLRKFQENAVQYVEDHFQLDDNFKNIESIYEQNIIQR